ncbi:prepilin-type N-terminal cleavage/methylation domain-containing protein [Kitasatospora sp. NPDC059327]|uniref:prepilin-type N-terminal cleavage/methylation domain-containing protein n=1 Tax=Kitasatospora sp. NPDC059327 TaxID=3346803 RepID=UPI0036A0E3D4
MTSDHLPPPWRSRRQDGFTLIELLVVIVILGVLAAIVVFSVRGIGDKGHKAAIAADAATLRTAEESYCAKHGQYATVDDLKADGLLAGDPVYNVVVVGEENKCGRGEKSSFALYDASTSTEPAVDPIPAGTNPADLAVDEKANRVYVVAGGSNDVTVIDGRTDTPIGAPIDVSAAVSGPTRIAVNPGTGQVYVGGTGGVAVIDTANANQVTRVSGFTATVAALAVSPENGEVYVGGGAGGNDSVVAYIPAGGSSATPIPLPVAGIVPVGMDFAFDPGRHAVYLTKANLGLGATDAAAIGLFRISSQTHAATVVAQFPTRSLCSAPNAGDVLVGGSARGGLAVDPVRNLVYLLARRCVPNPASPSGKWITVATTIVINPADGSSTPINDLGGSTFIPAAPVYNPAAGAVFVELLGGPTGAKCGTGGGRVDRIVGATVTGQAFVCAASSAKGNPAHQATVLKKFNRIFLAQQSSGGAPGGIGVTDGGTLLALAPLGTPRQFGAFATNDTTAKVYAVDPEHGTVEVFRTGSE